MKDGKAYGLAETSGANVLFINLDVLEQVGLDPEVMPTNWDELLAMADTVSKGNNGNCYFTYTPAPEGFWIAFRMAHWWAQAGVPIGTDLGVPTFNTPGAADVWLFHNKLMYSTPVDTMLLINAKGEGPAASGLSFDDGDIAMKAGWNNDATYILSNARAIQFPTPPGGKRASILIGNQINSPFKNGPNPELAISYIEESTSDVEAQTIKPNNMGIWLPTLKSLLEMGKNANYLGGYPEKAHPNVWVTMEALLDDGSGSLPGCPKNSPRIWTAWNDAYSKIWQGNLGKDDIQKELDALQTTAEGLLAPSA
jgi:ABC-type glycerol-3-phosphate transport system substrate-binding protein